MRPLVSLLAGLLAGLVLVACGYRGPLYLPGQEPVKKTRPAPPPVQPPASPPTAPATPATTPGDPQPARVDR